MTDKAWTPVLWALGTVYVGLGAWAAVAPALFTTTFADFGPYNPHLIHDTAAVYLAFGIGLILAARYASWRVPILALAATWNGLHTVSHVVDINDAATRLMGVSEVIILGVTTLGFAWLARLSARSGPKSG